MAETQTRDTQATRLILAPHTETELRKFLKVRDDDFQRQLDNRHLRQSHQSLEMASRPTVTILSADGSASGVTHPLPKVRRARQLLLIIDTEGIGPWGQCADWNCIGLPFSHPTRYRPDCPHRNGQEQASTVCSEREGWSPNLCRVLGYRLVHIFASLWERKWGRLWRRKRAYLWLEDLGPEVMH